MATIWIHVRSPSGYPSMKIAWAWYPVSPWRSHVWTFCCQQLANSSAKIKTMQEFNWILYKHAIRGWEELGGEVGISRKKRLGRAGRRGWEKPEPGIGWEKPEPGIGWEKPEPGTHFCQLSINHSVRKPGDHFMSTNWFTSISKYGFAGSISQLITKQTDVDN